MIDRIITKHIVNGLKNFPVVTLVGARQTGKTTLAKYIKSQIDAQYFDLENPAHRLVLEDPMAALSGYIDQTVIIDEAQRMPDLFPVLRVLVDEHRKSGRFFLLGSATPNLIRQSSESLAGRIITLELTPFLVSEFSDPDRQERLWIRGGFPPSYLATDSDISMQWRHEYMRNLMERDLRLIGFEMAPEQMRRFVMMLAHNNGQLWNASHMARNLGIGTTTANRYLDAILQTFLVRKLSPYFRNLGKRLTKAPKVYIRDSGILHALLKLTTRQEIMEHPVLGSSWESFVLENLFGCLHPAWELSFWRTAAGAEIDVLILKSGKPFIGIDIKCNMTNPRPRRGFYKSCEDLELEYRWVVYPGSEQYELSKSVTLLPLGHALNWIGELG